MTDDRIAGTARNVVGKVQQGVGRVTGDKSTEFKGAMNEVAGAAQDAYGKTLDAAAEGAQKVKEVAIDAEDKLRHFIESKPYTATAIALGVGLVIGYTAHRPPPRRAYWWD